MKKILIVDDMNDFAYCLKHILTSQGYEVEISSDGADALGKIVVIKPDLILMDLYMPGQDGAETVMKIRARMSPAWVRIVFLTALSSDAGEANNEIMVEGEGYPVISKMDSHERIIGKIKQYLN